MRGMSVSSDIAQQVAALEVEIANQRQACVEASTAMAKDPTSKDRRAAHRKASAKLAELMADKEALQAAFAYASEADRAQRRAERVAKAKEVCEQADTLRLVRAAKAAALDAAIGGFVNALAEWAGAQNAFESAICHAAGTMLLDNPGTAGMSLDRRGEIVETERNRAGWHVYDVANELARRLFWAAALLGHAGASHFTVKFMGNPNEGISLQHADIENSEAAMHGLRDFVKRWAKHIEAVDEQSTVDSQANATRAYAIQVTGTETKVAPA
jgi:hypothetical protein